MISLLIHRPKPVPLNPFVVKNGSDRNSKTCSVGTRSLTCANAYRAAVTGHDFLTDPQTQACAAESLRGEKWFEEVMRRLIGHAAAGIRDRDHQKFPAGIRIHPLAAWEPQTPPLPGHVRS